MLDMLNHRDFGYRSRSAFWNLETFVDQAVLTGLGNFSKHQTADDSAGDVAFDVR